MKWRPPNERVTQSLEFSPSVMDIFRQRAFWANAAGGFCVAYPLYFTITWLPFYLVHEQHLSMPDMVNKATLFYTIDAAAAFVTGWVTDLCSICTWTTAVIFDTSQRFRLIFALRKLQHLCSGEKETSTSRSKRHKHTSAICPLWNYAC